MEKYLALIKNKLVISVIVANEEFINVIKSKYDYIIDVTNQKRPEIGDSYYPSTGEFISNNLAVNDIPLDGIEEHLTAGTEEGFEPFKLSKYMVSYSDGIITVGCKQYPALGFLDSLHKVLVEKQHTTTIFTSADEGPSHGKYDITWEDARILHEALKKVKL